MKKLFRNILILICMMTFFYSAYMLVQLLLEYKKGQDAYEDAASNVVIEEDETVMDEESPKKKKPFKIKVNWDKFKDYPEVIGWIKIKKNKVVNYPILKTDNNEYYLHHLYDGTFNFSGSIFADFENESLNDKHVVLYGHNMKNGSMFSSIKKYQQQEYANKHKYIYIANRENETKKYQVFSCFLTDARGTKNYNAYQIIFNDNEEWEAWVEQTKKQSIIDMKLDVEKNRNVITLSTCMSRGDDNERCVVHAVEIE